MWFGRFVSLTLRADKCVLRMVICKKVFYEYEEDEILRVEMGMVIA
jgi:hypothetical protein